MYRGKIIDRVGNQHDLPATLLHQLDLDASAFAVSKDLLNPQTPEWAYYLTDNVMGWVTPIQATNYLFTTKQFRFASGMIADSLTTDSLQQDAKAFLQIHFQNYLDW